MTYEYDQYLAHHGIKGQKWGYRRFQNLDGSLTEAGKARYVKYSSKYGDFDIAEKNAAQLSKMPEKQRDWFEKQLAKGKKYTDISRKYVQRKNIPKGLALAALTTAPVWGDKYMRETIKVLAKMSVAKVAKKAMQNPKVRDFVKKQAWKKAGYVVLNKKNFTLGRGWIG